VFSFRVDPRVRRLNRLALVDPARSSVTVDATHLTVRFGPWLLRTERSNLSGAARTGPYRLHRVAGPARMSLADRGITFATTTEPGVCLSFHRPVRCLDPFGVLRHPAMTVTVTDPDGLLATLGLEAASPDAAPDRTGSLRGTAGALVSWAARIVRSRDHSVDVTHVDTAVAPDAPPVPHVDGGQRMEEGVGPWYHRRYRVVVRGASLDAAGVMAAIVADPNLIAAEELAPFVKREGEPGPLATGDRYDVEVRGPWTGSVEVVEVDEHHLRLATLQGHMESGVIEMRAEDDGDLLVFTIESWARSADHRFDLLYDKVGVAKALQAEMWVSACEAVVAAAGGEQVGPVDVLDERSERPAWAPATGG